MCGLVGIFNLHRAPVDAAVLERMTRSIAHRGPDGEGMLIDPGLGLGHRRLAIVDLSPAASQPMISADQRYALVYNGEIYNHLDLRRQLEEKGHAFRSRSDTEVILQGYAEWGAALLEKLNGIFAFAVWDRQERTLFLTRDRYGTKPLYTYSDGSVFLFASEIRAILEHPAYRVDLDREALLEYFTFQNFFTDRTLFAGVRILPAGTTLTLSQADPVPKLTRYWDFSFQEPVSPRSEDDYVSELQHLFQQAVDRQLMSDVELGAYLSGGMDSGSITAVAATHLPYLKTFTCGFDLHSASGLEMACDEREKAELMSYLFRTEHYEMVLKAGDMERIMPDLVRHLEEPRVGQSYPNYYVARLAGKFVRVVLSGGGGDELFGGYPWRYYRAVVNDTFEAYIDKYYDYWQRLIPHARLKEVFGPIWPEVRQVNTRDIFRGVFSQHAADLVRPEDYVNHSLYFEAKTFLHGLLVVEDKISMAHSLETRVPFLDNDLVDFAMQVPAHIKLGNLKEVVRLNENQPGIKTEVYFNQTRDGKLLLRKAMQRYIPEEITRREKQGFSAPDASWFRGESIEFVRRKLYHPDARIYDYFDRASVHRLLDEHLQGKVNRRLLVWSLLNFEEWLGIFLP